MSEHAFLKRPHRTLLALSMPVFFSLVAEPVAGLTDTAFVARLGTAPLAALGAGTIVLSAILWAFNFLGIGTQTEVARALGAGREGRVRELASLAILAALVFGLALIVVAWPLADEIARLMGARGTVHADTVVYFRIRLLGGPATIVTLAAFGVLRGLQEMRKPLYVALLSSGLNVVGDAVLVLGWGPIPALGVAGVAWATTLSQIVGALYVIILVQRRCGLSRHVTWHDLRALLAVGRDLFVRTGSLMLFLTLATRAATRAGAEAGAAHQAIRQIWFLTALMLDAYAATAQSLVGFFLGRGATRSARHVAGLACGWGVATGAVIGAAMLAGGRWVTDLLVPPEALELFWGAWWVAALAQPLNALSFVTDGIHWGTRDFRFLRNVMVLATGLGALSLWLIDEGTQDALLLIWTATAGWITVRALFGMLRIWPGFGKAPLAH